MGLQGYPDSPRRLYAANRAVLALANQQEGKSMTEAPVDTKEQKRGSRGTGVITTAIFFFLLWCWLPGRLVSVFKHHGAELPLEYVDSLVGLLLLAGFFALVIGFKVGPLTGSLRAFFEFAGSFVQKVFIGTAHTTLMVVYYICCGVMLYSVFRTEMKAAIEAGSPLVVVLVAGILGLGAYYARFEKDRKPWALKVLIVVAMVISLYCIVWGEGKTPKDVLTTIATTTAEATGKLGNEEPITKVGVGKTDGIQIGEVPAGSLWFITGVAVNPGDEVVIKADPEILWTHDPRWTSDPTRRYYDANGCPDKKGLYGWQLGCLRAGVYDGRGGISPIRIGAHGKLVSRYQGNVAVGMHSSSLHKDIRKREGSVHVRVWVNGEEKTDLWNQYRLDSGNNEK